MVHFASTKTQTIHTNSDDNKTADWRLVVAMQYIHTAGYLEYCPFVCCNIVPCPCDPRGWMFYLARETMRDYYSVATNYYSVMDAFALFCTPG